MIYWVENGEVTNLTNTPGIREEFGFWLLVQKPFQLDDVYTISPAGDRLSLRASPSLDSAILKKLRTGETVQVLAGPVEADGYTWWWIRTVDDLVDWAVEVAGWYVEK